MRTVQTGRRPATASSSNGGQASRQTPRVQKLQELKRLKENAKSSLEATPSPSKGIGAKRKAEPGSQRGRAKKLRLVPPQVTPEPDDDETVPQGGLALLPDMPLDILHEIFGHLEPYDLLRLSRTTRSLRAVLLKRGSRDIWKSSFERMTEQDGYPPCPDDMSEPAYANLMFSYHCHECNLEPDSDGPILFMFMEARTQLCSDCALNNFAFKHSLRAPFCEWAGLSFPKDWDSELNMACDLLLTLVPTTIDAFYNGQDYAPRGEKYHTHTLRSLWSEYRKLDGQEAKDAWLKDQRARREKIASHAELCDDYMQGRLDREAAEALAESTKEQRMKEARIERLKDYLVSLGWAKEIADLSLQYQPKYWVKDAYKPFHKQGTVVRLSKLSDKQFNAALQDPASLQPIVEWLSEARRMRHEAEKKSIIKYRVKRWVLPLYRDFVLSFKGGSAESTPLRFPSLVEICQLEEFQAPLKDTPFFHDTGLDVALEDAKQFNNDTWLAGLRALPAFVESWRAKQIQDLLDLLRNSQASHSLKAGLEVQGDFDESILSLAVIAFKCKACGDSLVYPAVFNHSCLHPQLDAIKAKSTPDVTLPRTSRSIKTKGKGKQTVSQPPQPQTCVLREALSSQRIWDASELEFHDAAFQHLQLAFELYDIPANITMNEFKERNLWFKGTCTCFAGELKFPTTSQPSTGPDDVFQIDDLIYKSQHHKKREAYAGSLQVPPQEIVMVLEKRNAKAAKGKGKGKRSAPRPEQAWAPCFLCPDPLSAGHLAYKHTFTPGDAAWYVQNVVSRCSFCKNDFPLCPVPTVPSGRRPAPSPSNGGQPSRQNPCVQKLQEQKPLKESVKSSLGAAASTSKGAATRSKGHGSQPGRVKKPRLAPPPVTPDPGDEDVETVPRGGLALLPEMPLDILHEIFGHLEPPDLLCLSRTTRSLRAVLLSRGSRYIWKTSLSRMEGCPPCPDDMCEPAYANLMFDPHCHECNLEPDSNGPNDHGGSRNSTMRGLYHENVSSHRYARRVTLRPGRLGIQYRPYYAHWIRLMQLFQHRHLMYAGYYSSWSPYVDYVLL